MLQLKRFQFNPYNESNQKILDRCAYPQTMDFQRWTEDKFEKIYDLYAVLVHEGSQASSGHYYVFLNIEEQWYRFNDERVQVVEKARALDHNFGGFSDVLEYDVKQMKVVPKQIPNKATAYLLVYMSRQCKKGLGQDIGLLPEWLIEHTKQKISLDEQKKARKQSICDIPLLSWTKHFIGRECLGSGLELAGSENIEDKVQMVPKSLRLQQWLSQLQIRNGQDESAYLLWHSMQRVVLTGIRPKSYGQVSDLFKDVSEPSLFFCPVSVEKDEFLVVIKFFKASCTPRFTFFSCINVKKQSRKQDLFYILAQRMPPKFEANFYIEDKKLGLSRLYPDDDSLLPSASPNKNQLLVAIIQMIDSLETEGVSRLYENQMDQIPFVLKGEDKRQYQFQLSKRLTVKQLRQTAFETLQKDYEDLKSPENLMFKYKTKRGGKASIQAQDDDILGDILKTDRTIIFCFSSLNASERHLLRQLTVYCRNEFLIMSEPIKIILQRAEEGRLLEIIGNHESIRDEFPNDESKGDRYFLLARDRCFISDLIDDNGRVPGKGELLTVLQRDKHLSLVIERQLLSGLHNQNYLPILIHHTTKTGQRFSNPKILSVFKQTKLDQLRGLIMDQIQMQAYEFEGRYYNFNPFKLRFVAYTKDFSKGFDLPEPQLLNTDQFVEKADIDPEETIGNRFMKNKFARIAVIHGYIAKGAQALKLNVQ